jgi:aldehyde:ferredoxin oxidoreductase
MEVSKRVKELSSINPMQEWTSTFMLDPKARGEFLNKYRKKNTGCFGCPTPCFAFLSVPDAGQSQCHCISYFYYPAATKYYGHSLERDQAVHESYVYANRLGLDHFELYGMIKLLEDLYEAGKIDPQPELPLDQLGTREFIQILLHSVATRRGIGDLFAEGSARAADKLKDGWEFCSRYYPAHGSAEHESPRRYPGVALLWALDSRDPIIDQHPYFRLSATYQNRPEPFKVTTEQAMMASKRLFGSETAIDHSTYEKKPEAVIYAQNRSAVINSLVLCDWVYPIILSYATGDLSGDTSLESQLLGVVTGYHLEERELDQVGERVWNLSRAIMAREGRTRATDTLHESYFRERDGEKAVPEKEFEKAKSRYYQLRGWDENTGWPTSERLNQLGLSDVAEAAKREGLIRKRFV